LSDDVQREFREVQAHFRLPSIGLVEKDLHVVRAIRAVASVDAAPFTLVFGGGTALARAHKIIRRMSEDVDFKIVAPATIIGRNVLRQQLGQLRDRMTAALLAAGFAFDPADGTTIRSRNERRYTVYQIPYPESGAEEGLRPTIQIELTYATLRLPHVLLPISSFVGEAYGREPDVAGMACVSITETAAEKLVSLTRRTAMDLAGLSRNTDPALVRHIYDLHLMRDLVEPSEVARLARDIAAADAAEFRNQYPAYAADIAGETGKALDALRTNPVYRARYTSFVAAMVYGEQTAFEDAMTTVIGAARGWICDC
jgi:predicted nucleotidyltransferase component of viral defense system